MFFVSTYTREACPLLALHCALWLWKQGLAAVSHPSHLHLETCPDHSAHTAWQRRGRTLLCVSHTQGWGVPAWFLHGPIVCKQDHNSPAQFPAPLLLGTLCPERST